MSPRTKRFLTYILLFIIAGMLTLGGIWWFTRSTNNDGDGAGAGGFSLFPTGNPSGQNPYNPTRPGFNPNQPTTGTNFNRRLPRLRMISGEPVAGYFPYQTRATTTSTGTSTVDSFEKAVIYTQRASGHMYVAKESTEQQERFSNTTIPKVYEALFASSTAAIYRYVGEDEISIRSYSGSIGSGTSTFQGVFLPNNLDVVTLSPDNQSIAYGVDTGSQFFLNKSGVRGTNPITLFSSYIKEWSVQWPKTDSIYLTSKADSHYPGTLYRIDPTTKRFDKLIADVLGLSTLVNASGTLAVISYTDKSNGVGTAIFDTVTREYYYPNFRTLSEKCVWSKVDPEIVYCAAPLERIFDTMPESWYMGTIETMDTIFRIDTRTMESTEVLTQADLSANEIDMYNLMLSEDEQYLYFMNKRDLTLWSYEVDVPTEERGPAQGPTL